MTGVEVGLVGALCTVGGGVLGAWLGMRGSVSRGECKLRSTTMGDRELEHYGNLKTAVEKVGTLIDTRLNDVKGDMTGIRAEIKAVDNKVDNWVSCILGDVKRGRRGYDHLMQEQKIGD